MDVPIATVAVGSEEKPFFVHTTMLQHSEFFKAALKEEWKEGQQRIVKLPDVEPHLFEAYIQWQYRGKINFGESPASYNFVTLAKLYGFGERLVDGVFQDRVLDTIVAGVRDAERPAPGSVCVNTIYRNTPEGSPARRLMVDIYVNSKFTLEEPEYEFLKDLTRALMDKRVLPKARDDYDALRTGSPCVYHKHGKDETCAGKETEEP